MPDFLLEVEIFKKNWKSDLFKELSIFPQLIVVVTVYVIAICSYCTYVMLSIVWLSFQIRKLVLLYFVWKSHQSYMKYFVWINFSSYLFVSNLLCFITVSYLISLDIKLLLFTFWLWVMFIPQTFVLAFMHSFIAFHLTFILRVLELVFCKYGANTSSYLLCSSPGTMSSKATKHIDVSGPILFSSNYSSPSFRDAYSDWQLTPSFELKFFVCRHVSIWGFQIPVWPSVCIPRKEITLASSTSDLQ